jgi:hypothetical protein
MRRKRVKAATKHARAKRDGIARLGGYEAQLKSQGGGCAICGKPPKTRKLNIDHDHLTGAVRGLLCHRCNRGLQWFSDSDLWCHVAGTYLRFGWAAAVEHRQMALDTRPR